MSSTHQNSRRTFSKFSKNTYDFPGAKNTIRTDQIFKESFLKILYKNRYDFPGDRIPKNRYL